MRKIISIYITAIERYARSLRTYKGFKSMKRFEDFWDLERGKRQKGTLKVFEVNQND